MNALWAATRPQTPIELSLVGRDGKTTKVGAEPDLCHTRLALGPNDRDAFVVVADAREGTSDLWQVALRTGGRVAAHRIGTRTEARSGCCSDGRRTG